MTNYGSLVHEIASEYGLDSFGLGKGEERYVCVCSRQPTQNEMISLRNQNPAKPDETPPVPIEQSETKTVTEKTPTSSKSECFIFSPLSLLTPE